MANGEDEAPHRVQKVSGHEREQHQTSDSQIQLATHQSRRQLLISSPPQTREDVLQRTQQPIFLDDVRLESKACTVQTNVEMTVPVEVVWLATNQDVARNIAQYLQSVTGRAV